MEVKLNTKLKNDIDVQSNETLDSPVLRRRTPFMYKTGILNKKFVFFVWILGLALNVLTYIYHNRPWETYRIKLIPANVVYFGIFFLAHYVTIFTHNSIISMYRIDLSKGKFFDIDRNYDEENLTENEINEIKRYLNKFGNKLSEIEEIFVSPDKFDEYQKKVYQNLTAPSRDYIAFILATLSILVIFIADRITGNVLFYGLQPYPVSVSEPAVLASAVIVHFTVALLAIGSISGLFVLIGFVRSVNNIGKNEGIIKEKFRSKKTSQEPDDYGPSSKEYSMRDVNVAKISIKYFKARCSAIPKTMLPITIVLLFAILGSGLIMVYLVNQTASELILFKSLAYAITAVLILFDVYLFFYPQISLHRIIKNRKENVILDLEYEYIRKRKEWLDSDETDERNKIWSEIQALSNFIQEVDEIVTWPFNYNQLLAIVGSGIITIIVLLNEIKNLLNLVEF